MRVGRLGTPSPTLRTGNSVILFWVGNYRMGIDAGALKEIRNHRGNSPEGSGCDAILSLSSLLGIAAGDEGRLLILRPGGVGVRADRVERMVETTALHPLPAAFRGAERLWYLALVWVGDAVCPLLNSETLVREATLYAPEIPLPSFRERNRTCQAAAR